jgi:hypothetical protein
MTRADEIYHTSPVALAVATPKSPMVLLTFRKAVAIRVRERETRVW